jgi:plastocyanin
MVLPRAVLVFPLVLILASCGSSGGGEPSGPTGTTPGPGPGNPAGVTVTVSNNDYSPDQVTVNLGTTVTWRWDSCTGGGDPYGGGQQCISHSVTFDDSGPSAGLQSQGSFSRTFATAGTYTYYCSAHGRTAMSGSIVAQ